MMHVDLCRFPAIMWYCWLIYTFEIIFYLLNSDLTFRNVYFILRVVIWDGLLWNQVSRNIFKWWRRYSTGLSQFQSWSHVYIYTHTHTHTHTHIEVVLTFSQQWRFVVLKGSNISHLIKHMKSTVAVKVMSHIFT